MKRTKDEIQESLKNLRVICETSNDPYEARIAQSMEMAITWATMNTVDWPTPEEEVLLMASILKKEVQKEKPTP